MMIRVKGKDFDSFDPPGDISCVPFACKPLLEAQPSKD